MTTFFWNWCLKFDYPPFQTTQTHIGKFLITFFVFLILWLWPLCDSDFLFETQTIWEGGVCVLLLFFHMKGEKRTDFYTYIDTYEQT